MYIRKLNSMKVISIFLTFILLSCNKEVKIMQESLLQSYEVMPSDYWTKYDYIQNVYEVFNKDSQGLHYLYDDTLHYIKDILVSVNYNFYFKEYGFYKQSASHNFVVGMGGSATQFHVFLTGLTYPLFDLKLIKGPHILSKYINWDGKPFISNADYNVGYHSAFNQGFITNIGKCDSVLDATINYKKKYPNSNGYEILNRMIYLAKDGLGMVQCNTHYECKNMQNKNDTIYDLEFKIKKILD